MNIIQALLVDLKWQFAVILLDWICNEMISCIVVRFTPSEATEILQMVVLAGHIIREGREEECDIDDKNDLKAYDSICIKLSEALYDKNLSVKLILIEDD